MLSSDEEMDLPDETFAEYQARKVSIEPCRESSEPYISDREELADLSDEDVLPVPKVRPISIKIYTCEECGGKFYDKSSYETHARCHCPAKLSCRWPLCPFVGQAQDVRKHVDEVHGKPFLYPCLAEFCTLLFTTRGDSFKHYKLVHQDEDEDEAINAEEPISDQNDNKPLIKVPRRRHKLRKHLKAGQKKIFRCKECDKTYTCSDGLRGHITTKHTRPAELSCTWKGCSFIGVSKNVLSRHIEVVHKKLFRIACPANSKGGSCASVFSSQAHAKIHYRRIHLKIRVPCKLASCKKTFYSTDKAHLHYIGAHEGFRWKCTQCDKLCISPAALRYHLSDAHGTVEYPCQKCDRSYREKSKLRSHIRRVHK